MEMDETTKELKGIKESVSGLNWHKTHNTKQKQEIALLEANGEAIKGVLSNMKRIYQQHQDRIHKQDEELKHARALLDAKGDGLVDVFKQMDGIRARQARLEANGDGLHGVCKQVNGILSVLKNKLNNKKTEFQEVSKPRMDAEWTAEKFMTPRKVAKSYSKHLKIDEAQKATRIRDNQSQFPPVIRKIINEWKDNTNPGSSLGSIEDGILDMIESTILNRTEIPCTEAELEVAIRFFPNLLWYPIEHDFVAHGCTTLDFRSQGFLYFLPFVPVFAKLGVESGGYSDQERGGLLKYYPGKHFRCDTTNILRALCVATIRGGIEDYESMGGYWNQCLLQDKRCLDAIVKLRELGIFEKADIPKHNLIGYMVFLDESKNGKRLSYLVDWCPESALSKIMEEVGSSSGCGGGVEDKVKEIIEAHLTPQSESHSMPPIETYLKPPPNKKLRSKR